ncbi:MAG: type III pantothenate kinase [Saccharospirillaceae bacterium]|nr:type III pantothenate kinase [Pseudomonadales bacterium]NRB81853.1 type III pantothenate kinase [Saccharospirillaceae bacterium]
MSLWTMDAGNTRLKLREIKNNTTQRSIIVFWHQVTPAFIQTIQGDRVIVTKVVNLEKLSALFKRFKQVTEIDATMIKNEFDFNTEYKNPKQLGVDRLLAALGARLLFKNDKKIAVINAGTATTVEIIENNTHLGGMIIAGNQLMLNSLALADQLPKLNVKSNATLGLDSISCMQTGLTFMNQGLVLALLKAYKVDNIVVCGGNTTQFVDLDPSINLIPDLIMQTLSLFSQKNKSI